MLFRGHTLGFAGGVECQRKAKEPTTPDSMSNKAKSSEQMRRDREKVETRLGDDKGASEGGLVDTTGIITRQGPGLLDGVPEVVSGFTALT